MEISNQTYIKDQTSGFTLIELLVVVAIVSLLASVMMISISKSRSKARDTKIIADIRNVRLALDLYSYDNQGSYPVFADNVSSNEQEWQTQFQEALKPYIKSPIIPPSKENQYLYMSTPGTRVIISAYGQTQCIRLVSGYYFFTSLENVNLEITASDGGLIPDMLDFYSGNVIYMTATTTC